MATSIDLRTWQKRELFRLLKLLHRNKGIEVIGLKEEIAEARAVMVREDIADVEKEIVTLYE